MSKHKTPEQRAASELFHAAEILEQMVKQVDFCAETRPKLIDKINACRKAATALGFKDPYV